MSRSNTTGLTWRTLAGLFLLGALGAVGCNSSVIVNGGSDTQGLVAKLEDLTDRSLTSFHGCYHASSFTLFDDLSGDSSSCAR